MAQLDEATIREHLQRRAGGSPAPARVDRLVAGVRAQVSDTMQRSPGWRGLRDAMPWPLRVAVAVALVAAISFVAVPFAGGPISSRAPSVATPPPVAAPTPDPAVLQVLSLEELQRVVALGDSDPYGDHIVVADVDLAPGLRQRSCLPYDCPMGLVVGSDPTIRVIQPVEDTDLLPGSIPEKGINGPVILRIRNQNAVELIGRAPMAAGQVAWTLPSFIDAVDHFPRRLDFNPSVFIVGPPYVVDAQLLSGQPLPCPTSPQASPARLNEFSCGVPSWLAPAEMPDPSTIIDSNGSHPADWVRVQNGIYQRYRPLPGRPTDPKATTTAGPMRGFYLVFPLVRYDIRACFQCDAGAVAILYAKLEPVPIP